jgi:hypothetical protein
MAPPIAAKAAPESGGDPQKIERLAGPLDFQNTAILQLNFVARVCAIDPALLASFAALVFAGVRA